jgi:hypothetical protein
MYSSDDTDILHDQYVFIFQIVKKINQKLCFLQVIMNI